MSTYDLCDWSWNDWHSRSFCLSFELSYSSKKSIILKMILIWLENNDLLRYVCIWLGMGSPKSRHSSKGFERDLLLLNSTKKSVVWWEFLRKALFLNFAFFSFLEKALCTQGIICKLKLWSKAADKCFKFALQQRMQFSLQQFNLFNGK